MASGITLSAGVRQNLLSLQSTADLMATTQNRLATGKKVNSALDNPSNFFTSQVLSDRASDLNSLLDSIGQATKTLDAANNGITSLTKLVQSAKSIAQQARQATGPVSTYAAVNSNSDTSGATNLNGTETIAALTGNTGVTGEMSAQTISLDFTAQTEQKGQNVGSVAFANDAAVNGIAAAANGDVQISVTAKNGVSRTYTVGLDFDATTTKAGLLTEFNAQAPGAGGGTLSDFVTATYDGANNLVLTANTADVDFTIAAAGSGSTAATLTALGITAGANNSTSLLDRVTAAGGTAGTSTLVIDVNGGAGAGGATKTLTFGTGAAQITTFADLDNELNVVGVGGGASGDVTGDTFGGVPPVNAPHLTLSNPAGATNTMKLTVSDVGVRTGLGMGAARNVGQTGGLGNTSSDLSRTFNSAATLADTAPGTLLNGGNLTITVNGSAQTVNFLGTDRLSDMISKLQANATLNTNLTFEADSNGNLKTTAKNADVDFQVAAGAVATGMGLATTAQNSTSLLDLLNTKLGGSAGQGSTLTIAVNGGNTQTITFGSGADQVSTYAEFSTKLSGLSGITATLSGASLNLQVASGSSATSLDVGGTAATALGVAGSKVGAVTSTTSSATRASLQTDFNNMLNQIDALSKDASYNGINLLNGDDLKVTFNENGTSSLTIDGGTFDANALGINRVNGSEFQENTQIDTMISAIDKGLATLRTQSGKFGSTLTTVQARQDFTKNMINTLQTGSDNLVLADTNEEAANVLALQTRQQLSTTALSLANQASQAVLRLF